jgi:phenylacetic acid degradation operon negative regulatory protein
MQPKTENLLNLLLWSADRLARPTFRNLTESYEGWAYRNGLRRQIATLERRQMLERHPHDRGRRSYRLTAQGRLHTLGGRDPEAQWSRLWDGQWRLALFDVPMGENPRRERMRRYLRDRGFGCLQQSVWITPDPLQAEWWQVGEGRVNAASLLLMEGRPCTGASDAEIVAAAWDFPDINDRYARHLQVLEARPADAPLGEPAAAALLRWAEAERAAWADAVSNDPLLPNRILPPGYLGRTAWRRRVQVLRAAGRQLRAFP